MMSYNPESGEKFKFDPERVRVKRFSQARDMAKDCAARPKQGKPGKIVVSVAGAKKRWVTFEDAGDYVSVKLINLLPAGYVTARDKGAKLLYHVPGAEEEPVDVPQQELLVRYTGTVAEDDLSGKPRKARKPQAKEKEKEPVAA